MRKSIRVRLLVWFGAVLAAVLAGFAGLLYYEVRAARLRELDARLEAGAAALDVALRTFPPRELGGPPPEVGPADPDKPRPDKPFKPPPPDADPDKPHPDKPGKPRPPGARPPSREQRLTELAPPGGPDAPPGEYYAVWRADGSLLKADNLPPEVTGRADVQPGRRPRSRGLYREYAMLGPGATLILVGAPLRRLQGELASLLWLLLVTGLAALALGLAGAWLIARRIFRPVAVIADTASRISAANLAERIDPAGVDAELAGLAGVLNDAFARLQAAFERQTRFTSDASHELRTPLAVIRSQAELALSRPRTPDEYRQALQACLDGSVRMTDLVERLLLLARADAGWPGLKKEAVRLDQLAREVMTGMTSLATAGGLTVQLNLPPTTVVGDREALRQVVTNLVSNAVRYNRRGGWVRVTIERRDGKAVLAVGDTGCGIPAADREHLFERFYRVDRARSRAAGGTGLGLAISREIARAHGGDVDFDSEEGKGSVFRLRLPREGDSHQSSWIEPV